MHILCLVGCITNVNALHLYCLPHYGLENIQYQNPTHHYVCNYVADILKK